MISTDYNNIDHSEISWKGDGSISIRGQLFVVRMADSAGRMVAISEAELTPELQRQIASIVHVALKSFPSSPGLSFSRIEYSGSGVIVLFQGKNKLKEINVNELPEGEVKSESLKLARAFAALRQEAADAALAIEAVENTTTNNNNNT